MQRSSVLEKLLMHVNNINYDNLLFVHVPKTAGQSIFSVLEQKYGDNWNRVVYAKHDPLFVLQKNNAFTKRTYKFSVVRNPFRRTFSYYKHFNRINGTNYKFEEFLHFVKTGEYFERTPMISYPQSFYCIDDRGDIGLSKVYKYEFLSELESDLDIIKINTSDRYGEVYEDIPRRVPSVDKAFRLLGWTPRTSMKDGVRKTVSWAKDNQWYLK